MYESVFIMEVRKNEKDTEKWHKRFVANAIFVQ